MAAEEAGCDDGEPSLLWDFGALAEGCRELDDEENIRLLTCRGALSAVMRSLPVVLRALRICLAVAHHFPAAPASAPRVRVCSPLGTIIDVPSWSYLASWLVPAMALVQSLDDASDFIPPIRINRDAVLHAYQALAAVTVGLTITKATNGKPFSILISPVSFLCGPLVAHGFAPRAQQQQQQQQPQSRAVTRSDSGGLERDSRVCRGARRRPGVSACSRSDRVSTLLKVASKAGQQQQRGRRRRARGSMPRQKEWADSEWVSD